MARRPSIASLDSSTHSPEYGRESPTAGQGAPAAEPLWSGSGGRWLLWPMRIVLKAAILIIGYRGISAIALNETPSSASSENGMAAVPAPSTPSFPVTERVNELAAFIPDNVRAPQPEFGWNSAGTIQLQSGQMAGVDVRGAHTAEVAILATVNGRLAELGGLPAFFQACASGGQATLSRFRQPHSPAGRRDTLLHADGQLGAVWPGQSGCPAVRCNLRLVGNRSARRKMVCKGDPCIYAADGDPMTRRPAPGLRHPGQLTDVHGREG